MDFSTRSGGLGLKKLQDWNRVDVTKHIWDLFIDAGSLWVAWVHTYLLQGKNFWYVHIPNNCSGGWRKILKLRDMVKPSFSRSIGNGVRTALCHGNWNSKGASFPKFVFRLVFEAVYIFYANVSSTLQEDNLIYPRARIACVDYFHWIPSNSSTFSCSYAQNKIQVKHEIVNGDKLFWHSLCTPKHS